jgi:hypothetical protein
MSRNTLRHQPMREYARRKRKGVISLKRLTLTICVALALMLGIASSASAAPSNPPNCFGQAASALARSAPGAVADFVQAGQAMTSPPDITIGTGVANEKATCGAV